MLPQYFTAGPSQQEQAPLGTVAVFAALSVLPSTLLSLQTFGTHAKALYNAEAEKTQVWRAATPGSTPPGLPLTTNAAVPQVDLRLAAGAYYNFAAAMQSGGGLPQKYTFGAHATALYNAEAEKTTVWASVHGGTVITNVLGLNLEFGTHAKALYDAEAAKSQTWRPALGTAGPSGFLGTFTGAQPQLVDLTLQPFIDAPQFNPQGWIVPFQEAEPQDGSTFQPPATLTPQATAVLYQPLRSFSAAPQAFDLTLPAVVQAAAQDPQGITIPPIRHFIAGQQSLDSTLQPVVVRSVASAQGVTLPSIRHFVAPPQSFDFTLPPLVQRSARTAGVAARYAVAAPQAFDFTLPAQVRHAISPPPAFAGGLGAFVFVPGQFEARAAPLVQQTIQLPRGPLGTRVFATPQVLAAWPTGYIWSPVIGTPPVSSLLGNYYFVTPQLDPLILEDPSGPYYNRPPSARRFGWAEVIALKQLGVQGVNTVIQALSQAGVQGAQSSFLDGSACYVTAAYFDENNLPFAPSYVAYRVDDLLSQTEIVPWTAISPAVENQVVVTSQQNQMISLSRNCEQHQVLFQIVDGYNETFYARVVYDLKRVVGEPT